MKKGSLNLSIQAIVIVVLGITLLGLGLGFVQGIFDRLEVQTGDIFSTVEADIKDKLARTNEPLYFPPQKLDLEAGDENVYGIGVKNTGDLPLSLQVKFQVRVEGIFEDFSPGKSMGFGIGDSKFVAGIDWDNSVQRYSPGQGQPIPFTLSAPNKFGNYLYKIVVLREDGEIYASKTFFVRTS
jgi:hypothetical protein